MWWMTSLMMTWRYYEVTSLMMTWHVMIRNNESIEVVVDDESGGVVEELTLDFPSKCLLFCCTFSPNATQFLAHHSGILRQAVVVMTSLLPEFSVQL